MMSAVATQTNGLGVWFQAAKYTITAAAHSVSVMEVGIGVGRCYARRCRARALGMPWADFSLARP